MANDSDDDRAPWAQGYGLGIQLMAVSLEMALPPAFGGALDRWLHSSPWLLILGAIAGFFGGMWQLLRMAQKQNAAGATDRNNSANRKQK